jgi:uncharacterized membrane protein YhaH (DUF805 family)
MSFTGAITSVLQQNYANFQGRAVRSEFWYWTLFSILVNIFFSLAGAMVHAVVFLHLIVALIGLVFSLGFLIPSIAVTVRRLHDLDKSGWWYFIILIPLVGAVILLIWFCTPGTRGPNRFGGGESFTRSGPMPMPVGFN